MTQTGTTPDTTQNIAPHITELLLPLEVPSSTQPKNKGRLLLIEEIKETTIDDSQMLSSPTNVFITESHDVTKAALVTSCWCFLKQL